MLRGCKAIEVGVTLAPRYLQVRAATLALCEHLQVEDYVVQSMPDASPTKWHLAHTTWLFERFVLERFCSDYQRYSEQFHFLFNSYYYSAGEMHARPKRGLLSRPTVAQVINYRQHVDEAIYDLLEEVTEDDELARLVELGLQHEQQHQELMLTDIKHLFWCNPLEPSVNPSLAAPKKSTLRPLRFITGLADLQEIGASPGRFFYDNEAPRHRVLLAEHALGSRLVANCEYLEFIRDGGYRQPALWLADGWAAVNQQGWQGPLYWSEDFQSEFSLDGRRDLDPNAPVTHISYYEADAFARWSGARLPTDAEWETAAARQPVQGNLRQSGYWHPLAAADEQRQFFGDVWEWTASPYTPYPGFIPMDGSLSEYNGKFMCSQMSVRGGSCVTADDHIRASYRNFFYPQARWQFFGIRLAKDGVA